MQPPSELRTRVLSAASRERAATRPQVQRRRAVLLLSACVVPVLIFLAFGGLRAGPRPSALVLRTALGSTAIALVALVVACSRGRSTLGRAGVYFLWLSIATPFALLAWKVAMSAGVASMMQRWPERVGFRCLLLSCLMSAWPLAALVMARKALDPLHPALTGAAIGSAIGASIWVLVDLNCPIAYVPHLLLGHALPLLIITVAGAGLGERYMAFRAR
jgi:hypothetical protein